MAYFVVERSGDGVLGVPLPRAYETREAAIAALSAATAGGEVVLSGEVFIADLGGAVPVLIMQAAPAAAPGAGVEPGVEPEAIDEEPQAEPEVPAAEFGTAGVLDEETADEAYTSWEPLDEVTAAGGSLADALKRAATSLEGEGIVAPDSIDSGADSEPQVPGDDDAEPDEADEDAALLAAAGIGEPPIEGGDSDEADDVASWPWANVESYEIKAGTLDAEDAVDSLGAAQVAEPASVVFDDAGGSPEDEIGADTGPIITSAPPEGEDAYMPQPVILGDYGDSMSGGEIEEPDEPEEPAAIGEPEDSEGGELAETPREPEEPEAAPIETEDDVPAEDSLDVPSLDDILDSITHADSAVPILEAGYEPAGDLDLAEYTCQDCVYSNTCPKVGQTTPAECGSFQWKSE